jgi:hypothetical protein
MTDERIKEAIKNCKKKFFFKKKKKKKNHIGTLKPYDFRLAIKQAALSEQDSEQFRTA